MIGRIFMWTPSSWPAVRVRSLLLLILLYAIIEGFAQGVHLTFGRIAETREVTELFDRMQGGLIVLALGSFALFRASAFHPVQSKPYRDWLKTSPWHPGLSLPLGPITLVWQDVVFVAALGAVACIRHHWDPAGIITIFGVAYTISALLPLFASGQRWTCIAIGIILAAVLRFMADWWITAAILVAAYPLVHFSLIRSLKSFPWEKEETPPAIAGLGWTFEKLGPYVEPASIATRWAIAVSLLLGAWTYAIIYHVEEADRISVMIASIGGGSFLAFIRLIVYTGNCRNPMGMIARIWTGHFMIPRYDRILIVPAMAGMVAIGLPVILMYISSEVLLLSPAALAGIDCVAMFLTVLIPGPTAKHWRLTGAFHIIPNRIRAAANQQAPRSAAAGNR